jgi:hypothetical protein
MTRADTLMGRLDASTVLLPELIRLRVDMPAEHDLLIGIRYTYGRT